MSDRIRFGEPIELALPPETLPPISLIVQQDIARRDAPFQVYIVKEAYDKAWRHVGQSRHTECGGILVGHPFRTSDQEITFIVIVDIIPQDSDNRSVGHFTVSPTEISEARVTLEQTGYLAVGWYHSHPGHGVFLSEQDMTIVRSIYDSHWHVAWVMDPFREEAAFFKGAEGKRLSRYYLLREEPEFVKASAFFTRAEEARKAGNERHNEAKRHFRQLKTMLDDPESNLVHWKETGRYQEVMNALHELTAKEESSLKDVSASPLDSPVVGNTDDNSGGDLMKISERYSEAESYLRDALSEQPPKSKAMSNAWQILKWIKQESPEYKDVSRLTYYSREILDILRSAPLPPRQLSLKKSRELEEFSGLLKQLL